MANKQLGACLVIWSSISCSPFATLNQVQPLLAFEAFGGIRLFFSSQMEKRGAYLAGLA